MINFPLITAEEIYNRIISNLPDWFGTQQYSTSNNQSVINVLLQAYIATALISVNQLSFCFDQIYIGTITDHQQLTLFAKDYFGNSLPQLLHETDASYKTRIEANLLAERCTRQAMSDRLFDLTGFRPYIFEPWSGLLCGGYGGEGSDDYSMGYSTHGAYGSGSYPYQCFIDVYVPVSQSMGTYPGYWGDSIAGPDYPAVGAYGGESQPEDQDVMWYGGDSLIDQLITDSQIYNTIEITKVFGTVCWTRIIYVNP